MFLLTSGDARGLGLRLSVCACVVGLVGHVLTWMRGTWGVVGWSAHVPTIPFTWLRRGKPGVELRMRPTCHQALRGTFNKTMWSMWIHLLCACSLPHGVTWTKWPYLGACDVNLVTWAKCSILIGSPKILLRSDWLVLIVASMTTPQ